MTTLKALPCLGGLHLPAFDTQRRRVWARVRVRVRQRVKQEENMEHFNSRSNTTCDGV
jgi:hypothetical protein